MTSARRLPYLALGVSLVVAMLFVGWNCGRIGVTWDEGVHSVYGERVVDYFASGFRDRSCDEVANMRYYGPLAEAMCALAYRAAPVSKWPRRHLVIGLFAIATLIWTFYIARATGSWQTAALAPIALLTLPRFVGHALINSKDIPFAAGTTAIVLASLSVFAARRFSWHRFALLSLSIFVTLGVRPGGVLLVLLLLFAAAAFSDLLFRGAPAPSERTGLRLIAAIAVGFVMMVMVWPFAHTAPLWNPLVAFANTIAFQPTYEVLFEGQSIASDELPARYLLQMLAITTPVTHLVLAGLGAALGAIAIGRGLRRPDDRNGESGEDARGVAVTFLLLLAWIGAPLAGQAILHANVYDGIRHFLFILPAIAILAARGAAGVAATIARAGAPRVGGAIAVLLLLGPVWAMIRLHPYQYTYYSPTVAGLGGAAGHYETDYWAMSYREAMEWISTEIAARSDALPEQAYRVLVGGKGFVRPAAEASAPSNVLIEVISDDGASDWPEGADWYVGVARYRYATDTFRDRPIVHRITRDGATLAVIRAAADAP